MASTMAPTTDVYAQEMLRTYQRNILNSLPMGAGLPPLQHPPRDTSVPINICIIGAGAAGLFAGLTLELLIKKGANLTYTILESESATEPNGEAHPVGGRLWTKTFTGDGAGANDYYDRGAMRFPDIPIMAPTFALFDFLGITEASGLRIPYVMSTNDNLCNFNGQTFTQAQLKAEYAAGNYDPFGTGVSGLTASPSAMVLAQIKQLKDAVRAGDTETLFKADGMSTRDFMTSGEAPNTYTDDLVTYLETFELGTNMYDASIAETVMEALDFDYYDGGNVDWYCVQGGSGVIATKMAELIPSENIKNGMRVTSLAPIPGSSDISVTCAQSDSPDPVTYDHVISTVPLSCLRTIDMSTYSPDWKVSTALRTLTYGPSTKVGIRFSSRWWENLETLSKTGAKNQLGGVTTTDRPTRVVVYPSYGIGSNTGATILVSYTWSQDALRLGALCQGQGTKQEETLKKLILQDLAAIHGLDATWLAGQVQEYDAWAWYNHENSAGAFAFFNPGQFSDLYPQVTQPMLGSLHFAGEATSIHHAWVVGALDSAFRTLIEIAMHEKNELMLDELPKLWPDIKEFDVDVIRQQVALGQNR